MARSSGLSMRSSRAPREARRYAHITSDRRNPPTPRLTRCSRGWGRPTTRPRHPPCAVPTPAPRRLTTACAHSQEYDFFYRNCNHFCYDMAERLTNGPAPDGYDEFIDQVRLGLPAGSRWARSLFALPYLHVAPPPAACTRRVRVSAHQYGRTAAVDDARGDLRASEAHHQGVAQGVETSSRGVRG